MYVSLFDINLNHITNLSNITGTLITKVYDFDEIKLAGKDVYDVDISELEKAKVFRLNDDNSKEIYSGFVYKAKKKHNTVEIIGNDFRTLLDTEILIDYSTHDDIMTFRQFLELHAYLFNNQVDVKVKEIDYEINFYLSDDKENFIDIFGEIAKEGKVVNFYSYLMPYIKYYDCRIKARLDWSNKKIIFQIDGARKNHEIKIKDFEHDLSQNQPSVNKTIAVMKYGNFVYKWLKQELVEGWQDAYPSEIVWAIEQPTGGDDYRWVATGNTEIIYEWINEMLVPPEIIWSVEKPLGIGWVKTGASATGFEYKKQTFGYVWQNVEPEEFELSEEEPTGELPPNQRWFNTGEIHVVGAIKYYYLTTDNQIVESDQYGDIPNRYYPVKSRVFIEEYLANAQFQAILELANQRYVDSIMINANSPLNPIDLSTVGLFDLIEIYDNNYKKTLPVAEKHLKIDKEGIDFKLKLGFKKERLSEIIRAGG